MNDPFLLPYLYTEIKSNSKAFNFLLRISEKLITFILFIIKNQFPPVISRNNGTKIGAFVEIAELEIAELKILFCFGDNLSGKQNTLFEKIEKIFCLIHYKMKVSTQTTV